MTKTYFPPQGTTVVTCSASKNGPGAEGLQEKGQSALIGMTCANDITGYITCLFFSIFRHVVLEESIRTCTTGQGRGPQLPWDWFHTAGPLHTQQT